MLSYLRYTLCVFKALTFFSSGITKYGFQPDYKVDNVEETGVWVLNHEMRIGLGTPRHPKRVSRSPDDFMPKHLPADFKRNAFYKGQRAGLCDVCARVFFLKCFFENFGFFLAGTILID